MQSNWFINTVKYAVYLMCVNNIVIIPFSMLFCLQRKAIDDATEACVAEAGEAQEQDSAAESASAEESVDEDEDDDIESENDAEEDEEEVGGGGGRRKRVDPSESRERKEKVSSTSSVAADAGGKRKINYLVRDFIHPRFKCIVCCCWLSDQRD